MSKKETKTQARLSDKCAECGSENLVHDYDTGETVCGDCGLVLYEQMMDKGPEWRAFTQEEKASRSRVGVPHLILFMIRGYPQLLAKLTEMRLGENCPWRQDCKCGVLENSKYAVESTRLLTETLLKPWLNSTGSQTNSTFHQQSKKKPPLFTEKP